MNHFRTTCLSKTGIVGPPPFYFPLLIQNLNVFSDIYVLEGQPYTWTKWLQFGDGDGVDPQWDEWLLFDEWNSEPDDIELPPQCWKDSKKLVKVQMTPCSNISPKSDDLEFCTTDVTNCRIMRLPGSTILCEFLTFYNSVGPKS